MLSKTNKQLIIDYIVKNLNEKTIESRDNIKNPFYLFQYPWYPKPFLETMRGWIKETYKFEDSEFDAVLESERMYESSLFRLMDDRTKNKTGYVLSILNFLKNTDIDLLKFTYNQTNYTPCHNILVSTQVKWFDKKDKKYRKRDFDIQIRENDFPFNEGVCYGRNTSSVKSFELTDDNIDKYCRKIGIKLI